MGYKGYYGCIVQLLNEDGEPLRGIEELDSVYFDYAGFYLGDEWVVLDVDEADGLDYEPDECGCLNMSGSFSFECNRELVFDDNFKPKKPNFEFSISTEDGEVDYEVSDAVISFWVNGEVRDFR